MTTRVFFWLMIALSITMVAVFAFTAPSHAQSVEYTPADTLAAIDQMAEEIQVPRAWLYRTVECETGGTFDPYAVGRRGELGAAQLKPGGELDRFYAWQYLDPFSPYQAIRFLAQRLRQGGASAWSCA